MNRIDLPNTIDSTGATDATNLLMDFINAQPPDTHIVFPYAGRFKCEGIVQLIDRVDLTISGNGSVIVADTDGSTFPKPANITDSNWPQTRRHVFIRAGDGIRIEDLHVHGAHPNPGVLGAYVSSREGQHGFAIHGSKNVTLCRCEVRRVYGDFLYLGSQLSAPCDGVTVEYSTFRSNGRQGVALIGCRNVLLHRCVIDDVRRTHIDIEPHPGDVVQNCTVSENWFGPQLNNWISASGADAAVSDNSFMGNDITRCNPIVTYGHPNIVRGKVTMNYNRGLRPSSGPSGAVWAFTNINGVNVVGNYQPVEPNQNMYLAGVRSCSNVSVRNNIVPNGLGEKITL